MTAHPRVPAHSQRLRRTVVLCATLALGVGLIGAAPVAAAPSAQRSADLPPTPPPNPSASDNPTDAQLQAAANDKTKLAQFIGTLNGKIASNTVALGQQRGKLLYAEQVMALKVSQEQSANAAVSSAKKAVTTATQNSASARRSYVQFVQSAYYGSDEDTSTSSGALLTATDPSDVLERSTLVAYQAHNKSVAIKAMQTAQVAKSNAEAKARTAKAKAKKATAAARTATNNAASMYRSTQSMQQSLQTDLGTQQNLLGQAQERLATLNGQRATYLAAKTKYNAYVAEKARLAAIEAARERAEQRAAAEARARAAAAQRAESGGHRKSGGHHDSGSNSGGGGSSAGSDSYSPPAPSGHGWTAAKGRKAAKRALSTLGIMYAWAGGNAYGPTRGVCAGDGAWNDCHVTGYDCSGLAMFAWGANWDHFAATQYRQAGSYHPSVGKLMPGDLLFWSYGDSYDIHHVAIYIGHGRMVEAPESNVEIRTASIYEYGDISYTTRPLT